MALQLGKCITHRIIVMINYLYGLGMSLEIMYGERLDKILDARPGL